MTTPDEYAVEKLQALIYIQPSQYKVGDDLGVDRYDKVTLDSPFIDREIYRITGVSINGAVMFKRVR